MPRTSSTARRLSLPALWIAMQLGCSWLSPGTPPDAGPPTPQAPSADELGTVLGTVNGLPVGSTMWDATVGRTRPVSANAWTDEEKQAVIDEMVSGELLFQEAFARGLYQDPKVRQVLINLLMRTEVYDAVTNADFTEEELRAFFDEHANDFVVPEKVQVLRIFIAALGQRTSEEAQAMATTLRGQAKPDAEAFRSLATEASQGPFAPRGGDLGFLGRDGKPGVPAQVVAEAFRIEEGEISEPFEAGGGWNIVYVPQRRERIERTFEQMRGSVIRRMKNERYKELTDNLVKRLEGKGKVQLDAAAIAAFAPPLPRQPGDMIRSTDTDEEGVEITPIEDAVAPSP